MSNLSRHPAAAAASDAADACDPAACKPRLNDLCGGPRCCPHLHPIDRRDQELEEASR